MGKKSLVKSTDLKKTTQTKKTSSGKSDSTAKAPGKPEKITPRAKGTVKTPLRKSSAKKIRVSKKTTTIKNLLFKKFKTTAPKKIFTPADFDQVTQNFTAPPFVLSNNDKDKQKIRKLLFNTYNMKILEAAAEKDAAEKDAAEKDAAEKDAAEKNAAEKDAAEKAAAEKDAAEKAVAEKDAAEKAAAEKAVAEKDAAEKDEPMDKTIKFAAIAFGLILIMLVLASFLNASKYYLMPGDGAIEIWQGDFAPMGKKLLLSIPGEEMSQPAKSEYRKKEVFPLAFNYYISQADALSEVPGLPDFKGISIYLHQALDYATDRASMKTANMRANTIKMLVLLYKAEVAAGKATQSDLESAADYLEEAAMLDIDATQRTLVKEKIKTVTEIKAELAAQQAAAAEEAQKAATAGETQVTDVENSEKAEDAQPTAVKKSHTE